MQISGPISQKVLEDLNLFHWIIAEAKKSEEGAERVMIVADY